jgi:hypothetical protein
VAYGKMRKKVADYKKKMQEGVARMPSKLDETRLQR